MPDDISPEEKLLKLITNKGNAEAIKQTDETSKQSVPIETPPVNPQAPIQSAIPQLSVTNPLWRSIIIILFCLCACSVVVLCYQLLFNRPLLSYPIPFKYSSMETIFGARRAPEQAQVDAITKAFSKPDLFKTYVKPIKVRTRTKKSVTIDDLLKSLFVVGIISGERPQAIIENRKTSQLHYVFSGDKIGDLEIHEVTSDKVIIRYGDEEVQLTL